MMYFWKPKDTWIFGFLIAIFILLCFMYSQAPSEQKVVTEFKRHYENSIEDLLKNSDNWEEVTE